MSRYAPTPEVMAIGQINISGNVTPATWWKYIRLPSGRPDATAIALLSEIVYWYRPTEVWDERCWDIASVFRATNCKEATRRLLSSLVSGKGKPQMR